MFRRARRRLTLLYIALFALALTVFSVAFYVVFSTVLAPTFDIAPELTSGQAAEAAYQATLSRVGLALVVGDLVVLALVGVAAWVLASWTLRPLRAAHDRQRAFVASASHEMRTPLTAIRASAEAALLGAPPVDPLREAIESIAAASASLARLTDDLLLLARADEGLLAPRTEVTDLSVLVAEALETVAAGLPDGPRPVVRLASDLAVRADPEEVRRIVINLIENAYRYGGSKVEVRITTLAADREVITEVRDDGPGIAAADVDRIFVPFYRVRPDAAGPAGSGLGLAIARSLAERNGGRLTVASSPGGGSTFRLSLSRSR